MKRCDIYDWHQWDINAANTLGLALADTRVDERYVDDMLHHDDAMSLQSVLSVSYRFGTWPEMQVADVSRIYRKRSQIGRNVVSYYIIQYRTRDGRSNSAISGITLSDIFIYTPITNIFQCDNCATVDTTVTDTALQSQLLIVMI